MTMPDDELGRMQMEARLLDAPDDAAAAAAIVTLLRWIGEDPERPGLRDTPRRALSAWREWTRGYTDDPAAHLSTTFANDYSAMIIVRGIGFVSTCEHHMAPIVGTVDVGYLPGDRIVGLSKIPRAVEAIASRLQVQERITTQIAEAMMDALRPLGVGVVVRAVHHCMTTRGVRSSGAEMITSTMRGTFCDPAVRSEFMGR